MLIIFVVEESHNEVERNENIKLLIKDKLLHCGGYLYFGLFFVMEGTSNASSTTNSFAS